MWHKSFLIAGFEPSDGLCRTCPECDQIAGHKGKCNCSCYTARTYWHADNLEIVRRKPILWEIITFRLHKSRYQVETKELANLVSSKTRTGKHLPIIDLDFPHKYVPSSTEGHGHLYLNRPISRWRWVVLLVGLKVGGALERGSFVWSLRRGANFVRLPGVEKTEEESQTGGDYGWIFKKKAK